jgi:isopenicillin N synthase-like dioxygenase
MTDTLASDNIASVSLADSDRDRDTFAQELGESFERYGFAVIRDHGIPQELIDRAHEKAKQFFALPEEVKRKYAIPGGGGARGYTPFGIETAKGQKAHDLKEFWHVGRELAAGHPFRDVMADNVWPEEVPGFRETFLELYDTFDRTGLKVLSAIARYLGVDEDYFADTVRDGNSVLRMLHYPPQTEPTGEHIRAGAHEALHFASGGEPGPAPRKQRALFDAFLPPLPPRFHDRGAAGDGGGRRGAEMAADQQPRLSPGAASRDQVGLIGAGASATSF